MKIGWKLNAAGETSYDRFDPEAIGEMEPSELTAFGVSLSTRYGQVREMIALLSFVNRLHVEDRDALRAMESVFWDTKACRVSITMRATLPRTWGQADADELALMFEACGGPYNYDVNTPHGSFECFGVDADQDPDEDSP